MLRIDIDIELTLAGPFITKSTAPGEYGIDAVVARNADGEVYIAGSHIVGKLRESWEDLENALGNTTNNLLIPDQNKIKELLGKIVDRNGDMSPGTKRLYFSDFLLDSRHEDMNPRYRIRLDEKRGAVQEGAQMLIESPFAAGEDVCFRGVLTFPAKDEKEAEQIRSQVHCGLQWVPQIGAMRSIGFGKLTKVKTGDIRKAGFSQKKKTFATTTGFDMQIFPQAPFCISRRRIDGNLFESETVIPGNVILGCLHRTMEQLQDKSASKPFTALEKQFNHIRVTHAFPSANCLQRPVRPPLSLVKTPAGLFDAALEDKPFLIQEKAPEFRVDWKDSSDVDRDFGWPDLRREMRVRTAIDSGTLRSKKEQLFAYDMVVPDGHAWQSRIDLSAIPEETERKAVMDDLHSLMEHGLFGLGKTKVLAGVNLLEQGKITHAKPACPIVPGMGTDRLVVITLQTPALLCSPQGMNETSGDRELANAYRSGWSRLCKEMKLVRYFAGQTLSGGDYLHGRYRKRHPYYPWLLTKAGSVFVFSIQDQEEAVARITEWLRTGLPLPESVREFYHIDEDSASQWKQCPYIPQNGYGEIIVNLKDHEILNPGKKALPPINTLQTREEKDHD